MDIDKRLLRSLIQSAEAFVGGGYAGESYRDIERYGSYEEPGLKLTQGDIPLTQLYAGFAVLARDIHLYLSNVPRDDAKPFEEAVTEIHNEDSRLHLATNFPYSNPEFPFQQELHEFPRGLAEEAARGAPTVKPLGDPRIRHEWTVKPGKRLFVKLAGKFRIVVCGKDGPYEQFENGLVNQAALPTTIASAILVSGLSAATLWYPVAVYISLLLIKTGLKTFCEEDARP